MFVDPPVWVRAEQPDSYWKITERLGWKGDPGFVKAFQAIQQANGLAPVYPGMYVAVPPEAIKPSRDALVYGTYEPTHSQVGITVPADQLVEYNSPSDNAVTIPGGASIAGKIIYGDITFAGAALLKNCLLVGGNHAPTSATGVLRCINTRTGQAVLIDCTIKPRRESNFRDCALGRQYKLERCHLVGGVDGCGIYANGPADVEVLGCLIEDLVYVYPDGGHTDGTHNDCIQIQGGQRIRIIGNSLRGTSHALPGTGANPVNPWLLEGGWSNGACVIVQNNVGAGGTLDGTVVVEGNWLRGGRLHTSVQDSGNNWVYRNNRHYYDVAVNPEGSRWWIGIESRSKSSNVTGLTAGGQVANTTNVFVDGPMAGRPLTSPQSAGIQSAA